MKRILWIVSCVIALIVPFGSRESAAQISVGPNVQVSRDAGNVTHHEVLIAADPADAKRLIACSMIGPLPDGKRPAGVYASFDGGKNWSRVLTEDERMVSADPACVFGINGSAHFTIMSIDRGRKPVQLLKAYHSNDGGKTWTASKLPGGSTDSIDREFLVADTTNSMHRGRVYIHAQLPISNVDGSRTKTFVLYRSVDGGKTYERPVQRVSADRNLSIIPGNAVVLSDGTFIAIFAQNAYDKRNDGYPTGEPKPASQPNSHIRVVTSINGGDTLDRVLEVSDMYADWRTEVGSLMPRLAADVFTTVFRDRLYAVWADGRFGGRTQVILSYSTDKGKTWMKPRIVNDDRVPKHGGLERSVAMPSVAVNKDGVVGVTWHDRRNSTNDIDYEVRFAASFDGGQTFTKSVKVSDKPNVFDKGESWPLKGLALLDKTSAARLVVVRDEYVAGGDTADLTTDANGIFHSLWVDNRTGIRQVWTSAITVQGGALKHGDSALAKLDDISSRIDIEVVDSSFDRRRSEGTLSVRLKNISKETIAGPIKLRALGVISELGTATITNADNGLTGDGAVWDFTRLIEDGSLAPDELSGVRSLAFRLTDLQPFKQMNAPFKWVFLDFDAVVLGSVKPATISQAAPDLRN